ncbi:MAG: DUF4350 domain-containing protein [Streptosporangiales bacterium]|nr:DUF4350 domain-containing protein [Streptosporangiales bacterium]
MSVRTTSSGPTAGQLWRAARGPAAIGLVLVLLAVVSAILERPTRAGYLDPQAPSPNGGRALAQILGDRGTTVSVAHSVSAARRAAGPETVLLVTRPWMLSRSQLRALRELPGDRVLVTPTREVLRQFTPGVRNDGELSVEAREPACGLRAARLAGTADMGGAVYSVTARPDRPAPSLCYAAEGKPSLVRLESDGHAVTVLGTGEPLTNDRLDDRGNAALALNLLGQGSRLVWLLPTGPPPGEGDKSPFALIPTEVRLAALQLGIALVLVALWRARRLGPVVTEPLPVVVRSAETVEGRGRLYRARRARGRAAEALRTGSRERITPRLGLTRGATQEAVVAAVAARTGRSPAAVADLLYGATPGDDAALVRLASNLDTMEREVGQS